MVTLWQVFPPDGSSATGETRLLHPVICIFCLVLFGLRCVAPMAVLLLMQVALRARERSSLTGREGEATIGSFCNQMACVMEVQTKGLFNLKRSFCQDQAEYNPSDSGLQPLFCWFYRFDSPILPFFLFAFDPQPFLLPRKERSCVLMCLYKISCVTGHMSTGVSSIFQGSHVLVSSLEAELFPLGWNISNYIPKISCCS